MTAAVMMAAGGDARGRVITVRAVADVVRAHVRRERRRRGTGAQDRQGGEDDGADAARHLSPYRRDPAAT
jgi:hypothetical protein